jgi:hypothetical protein
VVERRWICDDSLSKWGGILSYEILWCDPGLDEAEIWTGMECNWVRFDVEN